MFYLFLKVVHIFWLS